jgi:hypothetical protein
MVIDYSEQFSTFIKPAAKLRLQLEPWRTDDEFKNQGGRIFYAVDTDTVILFADPHGKTKYADIFPDDDDSQRFVLAVALGKFIFYELTKDNPRKPLLIIPPHNTELETVFDAINRRAVNNPNKLPIALDNLKTNLKEYAENKIDIRALYNSLDEILLDAIRGKGAAAQLSRITSLLKDDCLQHSYNYQEKLDSVSYFPFLLDDSDKESPDDQAIKDLTKEWDDRLKATKNRSKATHCISKDAGALGCLELINRRLEGKIRLVLITGDQALQKAAKEYKISEHNTFKDLFIRDPRVFMAAPHFLPVDHTDGVSLLAWLDVLFSMYQPNRDRDYYLGKLRELVEKGEKEGSELAQTFFSENMPIVEFKNKWQDYLQRINRYYKVDNLGNVDMFINITKAYLDKVRKHLLNESLKTLVEFYKIAATGGYMSTEKLERLSDTDRDDKDLMPLRGVPPLRFTLPSVKKLADNLCTSLCHAEILLNAAALENLNTEDPTGYSAFVIYAHAFAAAGRWKATADLSRVALLIADQKEWHSDFPKEYEPITGNEAAYLLAWATRHCVKRATQLSEAKRYLKEAASRKKEATGKEEADVRFDGEFIAINMIYHLFRIFESKTIPEDIPSLKQCQTDILNLIDSIETREEAELVKFAVRKQMFAYLFCAFILRQYKENESITDEELVTIKNRLGDSRKIYEDEYQRPITCFTRPVYKLACFLYGNEGQKACADDVKEILDKTRVRHCHVMPYDEKLYDFFAGLIPAQCN